jgi:hypothetical protein
MKPEAKSKVRVRHAEAIREFQRWKKANPKAKLARQIQVFDLFVDGVRPVKKRKRVSTPG